MVYDTRHEMWLFEGRYLTTEEAIEAARNVFGWRDIIDLD